MTQVYRLKTQGASPVDLPLMKSYMKVTSASDDTLIQLLIDSATQFGENYTGRDFRIKTWDVLLDSFDDCITLNRDPVDSIVTITRLVSGSPVTVSADVFYLKKLAQFAQVLLNDGEDWPDDMDERDQTINIEFTTEPFFYLNEIKNAILRHVTYVYSNRGDCSKETAITSGATIIYDQFRISRV